MTTGRVFNSLVEAIEEIKRDIYKGTRVDFSRVQQRAGEHLPGRERTNYQYNIRGNIPTTAQALVSIGASLGFKVYQDYPEAMIDWLETELLCRLNPTGFLGDEPAELKHPALRSTVEGNWPAYLYRERLVGAVEALSEQLRKSPDTRRAYWPIFYPQDALRAIAPTRVPCSLGYQFMLRKVGQETLLLMTYLQRSADFDTFWLSDVWLARKFQESLAEDLDVEMGTFTHFIVSFHSFSVESTEIY